MSDLREERGADGLLTDMALAVSALEDNGCDCGTDEPGTCLACVCERALRAERTQVARLREALRWHADSMNYTIEAPTWDQDEVIENSVNHASEALRQGQR